MLFFFVLNNGKHFYLRNDQYSQLLGAYKHRKMTTRTEIVEALEILDRCPPNQVVMMAETVTPEIEQQPPTEVGSVTRQGDDSDPPGAYLVFEIASHDPDNSSSEGDDTSFSQPQFSSRYKLGLLQGIAICFISAFLLPIVASLFGKFVL